MIFLGGGIALSNHDLPASAEEGDPLSSLLCYAFTPKFYVFLPCFSLKKTAEEMTSSAPNPVQAVSCPDARSEMIEVIPSALPSPFSFSLSP